MKFMINNITDYSAKANIVDIEFVNTNTMIDSCKISIFTPKTLNLIEGEINNLPHYICNGIWHSFNRSANIKSLEKQIQAKAPAGKKREYRAQVASLFDSIEVLNVKEEELITGEHLGIVGDEVIIEVKPEKNFGERTYVDHFRWKHNGHGWERPTYTYHNFILKTPDGKTIKTSTTSNSIANELYTNNTLIVNAKIVEHSVYHGVKQTEIKIKSIIK